MCKTFGFDRQLFVVCNVIAWYSYKGNSECIVENIYGPGSGPGPGPGPWSWVLGPALRSLFLVFRYAL